MEITRFYHSFGDGAELDYDPGPDFDDNPTVAVLRRLLICAIPIPQYL